ncbi:MAG: hypothetical protein F6K58_10545 [Symploca sp. SIO2E9]|nr:hypothetical protein [Symploca sp. SIO2E9]
MKSNQNRTNKDSSLFYRFKGSYRLSIKASLMQEVAPFLSKQGAEFSSYFEKVKRRWIIEFKFLPAQLKELLEKKCFVPNYPTNYAGDAKMPTIDNDYAVFKEPLKPRTDTVKKRMITKEEWEARFKFVGGKVVEKEEQVEG